MITWPGKKARYMDRLMALTSDETAICEPFLGSGAMSLEFVKECAERVFAAEACMPLYYWWTNLLNDTVGFVDLMQQMKDKYVNAKTHRILFDNMRDTWNQLNKACPWDKNACALLFPLVYQSTNYMARFNQSGEYNQTWGKDRNVPNPVDIFTDDAIILLSNFKQALGKSFHMDYVEAIEDALVEWPHKDLFVFLDPPYILEQGMYNTNSWSVDRLSEMLAYTSEFETLGVKWIYTDYLEKNGEKHPFYDDLKSNYRILELPSNRSSRPNGVSLSKSEVIIVGKHVDISTYVDRFEAQETLF